MAYTTHHMCLDIRGALSLPDRKLKGWFRHDDGRLMQPREVREALMDALAEGKRVLPMGGPCDGFDYQHGCPGHPAPDP
jgi:hypothetical protein